MSNITINGVAAAPAQIAAIQQALGSVLSTRTVAGKPLSADVVLVKADVGLGSVDNTSDASKPVSTAQAQAMALLAQLSGATFTGPVSGPTPSTSDSSTRFATTAMVQAALAAGVAGLLKLKTSLDASTNPNYPPAAVGDTYLVSVAGKVGGASGRPVDVGDTVIASAANAGGDQATVGASWFTLEHNLVGALLSANNGSDIANPATFWANIGGDAKAQTAARTAFYNPRTAAQLATTPQSADIALGDSALFYDSTRPEVLYRMNAGRTGFVGVGAVSGSGIVAGLVAGSTATAATNMTLLNAALYRAGMVTIPANLGVVYLNGTAVVFSDTSLTIGVGTRLMRTNVSSGSTAVALMANANSGLTSAYGANFGDFAYGGTARFSATLTTGAVVWSGVSAYWVKVTAAITAGTISANSQNGGQGYVQVWGDIGGNYNGVFPIEAASATQVTWYMPLASGTAPSPAGSITLNQADANITIDIDGYVDGGVSIGALAAADGLNKMGFVLNQVGHLKIPKANVGGFEKYCFCFGNAWDHRLGKHFYNNTSNGINYSAPAAKIEVDSIGGLCGDDAIAFIGQDYSNYFLPNAQRLGVSDVTIGTVDMEHCGVNAVAIYPSVAGQTWRGFQIGKAVNRATNAGSSVNVSGVVGCVLQDLRIGHLDGGNILFQFYAVTIGSVVIDDVPATFCGSVDTQLTFTGGTGSAGSNSITGIASTTGVKTGAFVMGAGIPAGARVLGYTGTSLTLDTVLANGHSGGITCVVPTARKYGVVYASSSTGYINTLRLSGMAYMDTTAAGVAQGVVNLASGNFSGIQNIHFSKLTAIGIGDNNRAFSLLLQSSSTNVATVLGNDLHIQSNGNFADGGGATPTRYIINNATLRTPQCGFGDCPGATILVSGIQMDSTSAASFFNFYGTSKTYNVSAANMVFGVNSALFFGSGNYGTTNTINLLSADGSVAVDGAKVTPQPGSIFRNTNAGYGAGVGLYGCGAAAGTTTRLAA